MMGGMAFTWKTPPWTRPVDCTHMAVMLTDQGDGHVGLVTESVRGDDATEALADLLMGPGGTGNRWLTPALVGVVIKRGIDVMWMAQPPIEVRATDPSGGWEISVNAPADEVKAFNSSDVAHLYTQLTAEYGKP